MFMLPKFCVYTPNYLYYTQEIFYFAENTFSFLSFFKKFYLFIFIFGWLGLHCCTRTFSSCGVWGLLFIVVRRLLIAVASLVEERGL